MNALARRHGEAFIGMDRPQNTTEQRGLIADKQGGLSSSIALSYCPGSKNTKPDTLSRLFSSEKYSGESPLILPPSVNVATFFEQRVQEAVKTVTILEACPPNYLPFLSYIPR